MTSSVPVALDLFSGAGGLAEGFLRAGIHVAAAIELHPQPALTHAFNHSNTDVIIGDIRDVDVDLLAQAVKRQTGEKNVDVVIGGPPCQGFSSAGRKSESDPRNSLFRQYVRIVQHFRPRMFVLENVPGFKTMYQGAIYDEAISAMHSLGYKTTDTIVHAKTLGIPQKRRRFVMVGWLPGLKEPFQWPGNVGEESSDLINLLASGPTPVTAGDALNDLSDLSPGFEARRYSLTSSSPYAAARRGKNTLLFNHLATKHRDKAESIIRRIPVGGSIRSIPADERGTKKLTMAKLDPAAVSNTVVSLPDDMIHYAQNRILTVREAARLQSFDDDYVFFGKRTSGFEERRVDVPQYTQVGNAVPPLLGEALGRQIMASFGAQANDLRDKESRLGRQQLVLGSSGYSGYELLPEARGEIALINVLGEAVELPVNARGILVAEQDAVTPWKTANLGRRGQWAPGVVLKHHPSWWSDDAVASHETELDR